MIVLTSTPKPVEKLQAPWVGQTGRVWWLYMCCSERRRLGRDSIVLGQLRVVQSGYEERSVYQNLPLTWVAA